MVGNPDVLWSIARWPKQPPTGVVDVFGNADLVSQTPLWAYTANPILPGLALFYVDRF